MRLLRLIAGTVWLMGAPVRCASDALEDWGRVVEDFRANYSYSAYKGVDWDAVYERHKGGFAGVTSGEEFAVRLNEALLILEDWHVAVQKPDGTWLGYSPDYPRNYPSSLATRYAARAYENVLGAGALVHTRLTNGSAHLIVPTLDTATFNRVGDNELREVMRGFRDAKGLIVDLRYNTGGNELHGRRLAAFLVREVTRYGYTRTRAPSEPGGFLPKTAHEVTPDREYFLDVPAVVLTGRRCLSSCEWLVLMLGEAPHAILMGDRTRGGTGNPVLRSVASQGVNYLMSRWIGLTVDEEIFEGRGIEPDLRLRPEWSYDDAEGRDLLLEHAMAFLDARAEWGLAGVSIRRGTDSDGDGTTDVLEYVAGSDPLDAASRLRLSLLREPARLRWEGVPRRAVVIEETTRLGGEWTESSGGPYGWPETEVRIPIDAGLRIFRMRMELAP